MAEIVHDSSRPIPDHEKPLWSRVLGGVSSFFLMLFLAWLFSVVVEWIGMVFFWPEEGAMRSYNMITTELTFLNDDFKSGFLGLAPVDFARWSASRLDYYLFEWTNFRNFIAWGINPTTDASNFRFTIATIILISIEYISALINVTQVFGIRLAVAILTTPIFILFGIAALIDGLVYRELRRYGGANESSFIYHKVKPWIKPAFITTWFIYLGAPFSIHPNFVFIPAAAIFSLAIFYTAGMFKKYA